MATSKREARERRVVLSAEEHEAYFRLYEYAESAIQQQFVVEKRSSVAIVIGPVSIFKETDIRQNQLYQRLELEYDKDWKVYPEQRNGNWYMVLM